MKSETVGPEKNKESRTVGPGMVWKPGIAKLEKIGNSERVFLEQGIWIGCSQDSVNREVLFPS